MKKGFHRLQRWTESHVQHTVIIAGAVCIILALMIVYITMRTLEVGIIVAEQARENVRIQEEEEIYTQYYEKSYNEAEKKYHTSNRVSIQIEQVREQAELEILNVSAVGYDIMDKEDSQKVTSWVRVTAKGIFTVNLSAGEYLVDDERNYVCIRIPKPEFTHFSADKVEQMNYQDNKIQILDFTIGGGSIKEGVDLAQEQYLRATADAKESILSNQRFYKRAEDLACIKLENLVKKFNPQIQGLTVEIERLKIKSRGYPFP